MRTGTGRAARGVWRRSGRGWSRAPPDPCTPGTRRKSITTCTSPPNAFPLPEYHRWRPVSGVAPGDPVGADQGPVQAGVRLLGRAQSLKDLGKVRGPVGDHPQGPVAGTCRPWPGSPSSRGPGWSGRCPPPSTAAPARPEPGRWPPSARASRRAPCGGPPTTGRWCGRWTREHREWQDRTARGDPLVVIRVVRTHYPGPVPARTTPTPPNPSRTTAPILASRGALLVRKAQCELSSTKSTSARFVRAQLAQCELR